MTIRELSDQYVLQTYTRFPLTFTHGEGMWLYAEDDKKYLDMASGIAVSALGHSHPGMIKAISNQAKKLLHTSNLYYTAPYAHLAEKLIKNSIFDKVFFCNSGAEANEAAIKLARKYGIESGNPDKFTILTMEGSFHGRTMGTISATGQKKFRQGFEPVLDGFVHIPPGDIVALEDAFSKHAVSAVFIETVQGEGGIRPLSNTYIKAVRELCDQNKALMMVDEVQTGIGRTGRLFGYEHHLPVQPDVITLAKGLAGGLPIGAMLVKDTCTDILQPGNHASTFGGNPVSCAAANVVMDEVIKPDFLKNVEETGSWFREQLLHLKENFNIISDVRGTGYMNGIELQVEAGPLINELIEKKIITVPSGKYIIRFLPPLIATKEDFKLVLTELERILSERVTV